MTKIIMTPAALPYSARMKQWKTEYLRSIKSPEAEDRFDLIFYRPLGFLLAKLSWKLGLTPTQVTILGMVSGIIAGVLYSSSNSSHLIIATLLFLLSGILDSADGQLARLSNQSSPFGLVIDGFCDNIVFISVYLGCIWALLPITSHWIWPMAFAAGFSHSCQSAILDFYGREYLYYTGGLPEQYRNPNCEEAQKERRQAKNWSDRLLWRLRYSWLWQQQLLSTRSQEVRTLFDLAGKKDPESFRVLYREHHRVQLRIWQVLGANVHTLGIILFAFLARFDLYLALVDLGALNIWMLYARRSQLAADWRMAREVKSRFAGEAGSESLINP